MTVKDFLSKILDPYQEISINECIGLKYTGRRWVIAPHENDYTHIPEKILSKEIKDIILYYDRVIIGVEM